MNKAMLKCSSRVAIVLLCVLGLIELGLALWTVLEDRYKSLAYSLADVGYIVSIGFEAREVHVNGNDSFCCLGSVGFTIPIDVSLRLVDNNFSDVCHSDLGPLLCSRVSVHRLDHAGIRGHCRVRHRSDCIYE